MSATRSSPEAARRAPTGHGAATLTAGSNRAHDPSLGGAHQQQTGHSPHVPTKAAGRTGGARFRPERVLSVYAPPPPPHREHDQDLCTARPATASWAAPPWPRNHGPLIGTLLVSGGVLSQQRRPESFLDPLVGGEARRCLRPPQHLRTLLGQRGPGRSLYLSRRSAPPTPQRPAVPRAQPWRRSPALGPARAQARSGHVFRSYDEQLRAGHGSCAPGEQEERGGARPQEEEELERIRGSPLAGQRASARRPGPPRGTRPGRGPPTRRSPRQRLETGGGRLRRSAHPSADGEGRPAAEVPFRARGA